MRSKRTEPPMRLPSCRFLSTVAFSKDAFPTRRRSSPAQRSLSLPEQALFSCVTRPAQYQAFVRSAVTSSAALKAIALNWTGVLEPLPGAALALRPCFRPQRLRACTDVVPET